MNPIRVTASVLALALVASSAVRQTEYGVTYSGGSLPSVKPGQTLHLLLDPNAVRLYRGSAFRDGSTPELNLKTSAITEISYGQEAHHRVGAAVATAVFSLGIGILVATSKTKKHYVGLTWADGETKGGLVFQADKNEFRGIIAALEGMTGKRAVGTDPEGEAPTGHSTEFGIAPKADQVLGSVDVASTPSDALVEVDGYPAGKTPVNVKLAKGEFTLKVSKNGFQTWSQKITVEPGKAQTVGITLAATTTPLSSGLGAPAPPKGKQ